MSRAQPACDLDLAYGLEGERYLDAVLRSILSGDGKVEVKRKRWIDLYFYVETECDRGGTGHYVPSGIHDTRAATWVVCIEDSGIFFGVPTALVRDAIVCPSAKDSALLRGTCPTRGKLVNLGVLLYLYKKRVSQTRELTADQVKWE